MLARMDEEIETIGGEVATLQARAAAAVAAAEQELADALDDLDRIRKEHGGKSTEHAKGMARVKKARVALGDDVAQGGPGRVRDNTRRAQERRDREALQREIGLAADKGDLGALRQLGIKKMAEQLAHRDPVRVRDAARVLLNEISVDDDDEARIVTYVTPAAPGWAAFPPVTHYLLPDNVVDLDAHRQ